MADPGRQEPADADVEQFMIRRFNFYADLQCYAGPPCDYKPCKKREYMLRSQMYMFRIRWLLDFPNYKQPDVMGVEIPYDAECTRYDLLRKREEGVEFQRAHGFLHWLPLFNSEVFRKTYVHQKELRAREAARPVFNKTKAAR